MGADSILGLLFEINADPSKASQAIANFEKATGKAFQQASNDGPPKLDKALLNTHNSVHLLTEELGIHLPRAVVGGIAEMLPQINILGGALLGVFAVEELYKFSRGLHDIYDEFDEVKQGEEDMARYVRENTELMERQARASTTVANNLLHQAQAAAAAAAGEENEIENWKGLVEMYMGPVGAAMAKVMGLLSDQEAAHKKVTAAQQMADTVAKIFADDQEKDSRKGVEAAKRLEEANKRLLHVRQEDVRQMQAWAKTVMPEYNAAIEKEKQELMGLDSISLKFALDLDEVSGHVSQVSDKAKIYNFHTVEMNNGTVKTTSALQNMAKAMQSETAAGVSQLTTGLAGLIGGRKAQAAVEGAWEIANGIACLAEGTWPPNPAAIIASGLHFESAANFFKIAGQGGAHRHASAGGGIQHYPMGPGAGRSAEPSDGGREASGRAGTSVTLNIQGNLLNHPASIDYLVDQISQAVDNRDAHLSATRVKDSTLSRDSFNS
jgi:hypothetical protein